MRYYVLLAAVSFAGFAVAATLTAVAIALLRPRYAFNTAPSPRRRAGTLVAWRMAPTLAGMLTTLLLAAAFVRYEPGATGERPGWVLAAAAAAGVLLWTWAFWRAARDTADRMRVARLARQCSSRSRLSADVVVLDAPYPVAAVSGWRRPRVLLSSRILAECTTDEVELIVAHERAHVLGGDNIVRALLRCLPDPLGMMGAGMEIERAWMLAVEEAADDRAAGADPVRRAALASALVRVAGLADGPAPPWMPALAFYQGEHLAQRISRLLEPRKSIERPRWSSWMLPAGVACVIAAGTSGARTVHEVTEWIVRSIP